MLRLSQTDRSGLWIYVQRKEKNAEIREIIGIRTRQTEKKNSQLAEVHVGQPDS